MWKRGILHTVVGVVALAACANAQQMRPTGVYFNQRYSSFEDLEWERLKHSDDIDRLERFASRYPKGRHQRAVAQRIAELQRTEPAQPPIEPSSREMTLVQVESERNRGMVLRVIPAEK